MPAAAACAPSTDAAHDDAEEDNAEFTLTTSDIGGLHRHD